MKRLAYEIPALKWLRLADEPLMAAESLIDIDDDDDSDEASKRGRFDDDLNDPFARPRSIWDNDPDGE